MNRTLFGDCRQSMKALAAQGTKVQMCVTSPPYFGLRDYGVDGQLGLEKTPAEYVAALVEVFEGVRELLADDGVLWLNLGDSYNGYMANQRGTGLETKRQQARKYIAPGSGLRTDTMKNKDLMGMPWRVAFALQERGWYLRQDIIWHKPNPMPESVTDRCTKAHEYLFLLSKSERYYFDAVAMREDAVKGSAGSSFTKGKTAEHQLNRSSKTERVEDGKRNRRSVWTVATKPYKGAHFATFPPELITPCILAGSRPGDVVLDPFMGSGTTAQVAQSLGRNWLGCELNPEYAPLQLARLGIVL
jgi:DNA modification methylase